ncbi:MAG: sulfatase-like hydrolase/transferase [Actinomycetota bacterium]
MVRPWFLRFATPMVLAAFALTWPVLDILGNNAEFFIARGSGRVEIVLVAVILGLAIPVLAGLPGLLDGRVGRAVSTVWTWFLASMLALLVLRRLGSGPVLTGVGAIAGGALITAATPRFEWGRNLVRYLSAAPAVMFAFFLLATPAGGIVTDPGAPPAGAIRPVNPVPLVLIIFDEFPLTSLIDRIGNLRADRYPNFARLADDGIWYRNAVTVQQQTEHSVPAILTGIDPAQSLEPFAGHYPGSLFTALSASHQLFVDEAITRLCPVTICENLIVDAESGASRLVSDLGIITGHVLLPQWATGSLPEVDHSWGDFGAATADFDPIASFNHARRGDPRRSLELLADRIRTLQSEKPPFFFTHALLPHNPWQLLPTGQRYPLDSERMPGSSKTGWGEDEWLASQALQRHLLQVGYVDRALGDVLAALDEAELYDRAMIVVVADHGIALKTNLEHWRQISEETIGEIAAVPLFVKPPLGSDPALEDRIDDRRSLTIDIVPTIAEVMGFDPPWTTVGVSLLGPLPERDESFTTGPGGSVTYGVDGSQKLVAAGHQETWFPNGDPYELLPPGAVNLVGTFLDKLTSDETRYRFSIDHPDWYSDVDPDGDLVPARITGVIAGLGDQDIHLAVAVNGVVEAVVRSYHDRGETGFQAMVRPAAFQRGANLIEVVPVPAG